MFGKKGYEITKHTHTEDGDKFVFHLTMRDDNMVIVTSGYDIVGGRVHMSKEEADTYFAKSCVELGIAK